MTSMAKSTSGLFDPAGVEFRGVSHRLIAARLIAAAGWLAIPFAIGVVLAITVSPWNLIQAGIAVVVYGWIAILVPRQVRAIGYAERDDDLFVRRGILFRSLVVVPYGRMQYVDVKAGPLDRRLGIAAVQLHTAAAATDASIPGLAPHEAARLRDRLSARGEARLAGL
jgi:membrane protein YdbS with pleckstrin-like domain